MTASDELAAAQAEIAQLKADNYRLRGSRSDMDCRYTNGNVADLSGTHCDDRPCDRCRYERRIDRLEVALDALYGACLSMSSAGITLAAKHREAIFEHHDKAMALANETLNA